MMGEDTLVFHAYLKPFTPRGGQWVAENREMNVFLVSAVRCGADVFTVLCVRVATSRSPCMMKCRKVPTQHRAGPGRWSE